MTILIKIINLHLRLSTRSQWNQFENVLTIFSDIIRESFFNQLPPSSFSELFHLTLSRARKKG